MPAYVLHQNMRTFGSQALRRNQAYRGEAVTPSLVPPPMPPSWPAVIAARAYGFPYIHDSIGLFPEPLTPNYPRPWREPICIAGFTELNNANPFVIAECSQILMGIDGGTVYPFSCGITALARGPEWLAIAVAGWVNVLAFGRVAFWARDLACEVSPAPVSQAWLDGPPQYGADRRWVVYVVVQLHPAGRKIAIGFIHNTYKIPTRFDLAPRLPYVIAAIKGERTENIDQVILGGDFNLRPRGPGTRRPFYTYSDVTKAAEYLPFSGGVLGGTTWSGNLYDYWLSDIDPATPTPLVPGGISKPRASVSAATWDGPADQHGLMSDHVATLLRIV